MALEDELASIMREHDGEAPRAAELPDRPWAGSSRRRRFLLPAAAAAAVVLIGAGAVTLAHRDGSTSSTADRRSVSASGTATPGARQCPSRYPVTRDSASLSPGYGWVPSPPAGVDTAGRLTPSTVPDTAVVCAYGIFDPLPIAPGVTPRRQTGRKVLTTGLDALRAALFWIPPSPGHRGCLAYGLQTDDDNLLIGLTYPDGAVVWVSAPGNHCAGSTNGVVDTDANLRAQAVAAYESGRWPASGGSSVGRYGQQDAMAPAGVVGASVDRLRARPNRSVQAVVPAASLRALVDALNRPASSTTTHGCSGGGTGDTYNLSLTYADGPPVSVHVDPSCRPAVDNNGRQSAAAPELLSLLERLTR